MTTSECVSLRIREVLNKKQMTIYKLEQISCISHSTMKALLNNVNNSCNVKTLFLIIQSLEMTVLDFFNSPLFEDLYNINLD
ncbi:MAG: helix-turn-helix domain-containing protein [Clostridia bacterium]|nr:helix-turn-helix domain-containing protein [Clostridia bacterium]